MSITKTLAEKDTTSEAKLDRVAEIVAQARVAYGNEDAVIESPMIETVNGRMSFVHLDDDSKVSILRDEVARLKSEAVEFCENTPGSNLNGKIAERLAVNGMFVNIAAGTKFDYI